MGTNGVAFDRDQLLALLPQVYRAQRDATRARESYDTLRKPIQDYFAEHSEEVLRDAESGVQAQLRGGGDDHVFDFATLLRDCDVAEAVLVELAGRGLLKMDWQGFVRQETSMRHGNTARRFTYTVPRTRRLTIEKERS